MPSVSTMRSASKPAGISNQMNMPAAGILITDVRRQVFTGGLHDGITVPPVDAAVLADQGAEFFIGVIGKKTGQERLIHGAGMDDSLPACRAGNSR